MIGSLLYLTVTRSNIQFAVCLCACFQASARTSHHQAVKRIFRLILQVAELRKRCLNQNNSFFEVQFLLEDNMNITPCSIKTLKGLYDISVVEVGQHFYWQIGGFQIQAQVLITSWVVITILLGSIIIAVRNPQTIPTDGQNFFEYALEFIRDLSKTQIGEEYGPWIPFIGTMFLFIFVLNWSGSLLPWKIIELPHGELAAPTNDINTTAALALLTSAVYFYVGLSEKGLSYFEEFIKSTPILLPINILEDFTKPLSLSFRLFGNILVDELVVVVLVSLVPLVVPIPVMFLGLFTSSIQALIFATLAAAYIGQSMEGHH
ncbi:hypothetical protein BS78_K322700 [Paspalum vaginatum]|uniref:ATP synthase subunit a, chloroplastic n=1 Tax=Paspalum vaginatum TaxID=158149 RepID=A0A9W7XD40_9POAL|nr:hypothetical protein BS78_K322700 [Paspalum vaginatum]